MMAGVELVVLRDVLIGSSNMNGTFGIVFPMDSVKATPLFEQYDYLGEVMRSQRTWMMIDNTTEIIDIRHGLLDYTTEGKWLAAYKSGRDYRKWSIKLMFECPGDAAMFRLLGLRGEVYDLP